MITNSIGLVEALTANERISDPDLEVENLRHPLAHDLINTVTKEGDIFHVYTVGAHEPRATDEELK